MYVFSVRDLCIIIVFYKQCIWWFPAYYLIALMAASQFNPLSDNYIMIYLYSIIHARILIYKQTITYSVCV